MSYYLSPIGNDQQCDANGNPLVGGKIYTYLAGTSTPAATYTDSTSGTSQANPIILNSLGLPASAIWMLGGQAMKFVIQDSSSVLIRTIDNVTGINDTSSLTTSSEWVSSGFTPTYISGTSFSVVGDKTSILQANRRVQTTNAGGSIYSSIVTSVYSVGITTVTVANDSGTLDAGLSVLFYGMLSATNPSVPAAYAKDSAVVHNTGNESVGGNKTLTGVTTFSNMPVLPVQSMVRLNTGNGHGSTNTVIRRFANVVTNQGSDITYADSATLGATFTTNVNGVYAITYSDQYTGATGNGLSLNSANLTTSLASLPASEVLSYAYSTTATAPVVVAWVGYLPSGSVIRAHDYGSTGGAQNNGTQFTISRVG
jgi:hypothetical protein